MVRKDIIQTMCNVKLVYVPITPLETFHVSKAFRLRLRKKTVFYGQIFQIKLFLILFLYIRLNKSFFPNGELF